MSLHISESDWRRFREVHGKVVERFCADTLARIVTEAQGTNGTAHERYLRVYKLIQKQDKELGRAFDDFRRSTAVMQLGIMRRMGLLTDEELSGFSQETQARVRGIASL